MLVYQMVNPIKSHNKNPFSIAYMDPMGYGSMMTK
jgi:hypothetical protein